MILDATLAYLHIAAIRGWTVFLTSQSALLRGDGAAGDARVVDINGITLSGAQAANYTLAATAATTTANIAKRPIGVSGISALDRSYDATTAVSITVGNATVNTSSIIAGDDVSVIVPPSGISSQARRSS